MKKGFLNGLAMIVLVIIAAIILLNYILTKIGGSAGDLVTIADILVKITHLLGYAFLAIYAYDWVKGQRKKYWTIIYICAVIVLLVFVILSWI